MTGLSHDDDQRLIQRIITREQDALHDLYHHYGQRVYQMAYQVTQHKDTAEEVTQDVFFQIWRWPERWNPDKGRFLSWVLTVTRYTAIDTIRREQRQPTIHPYEDEFIQPSLNGYAPTTNSDAEQIQAVLRKLPKEQRVVILLAFFRGMTHDEIAAHLKLPVGTVKSRIRLGMKKLKDHLLTLKQADIDS